MIMNPTAIKHVVVDGHSLTLESFVAIARYNATVELAPSALEAMQKSRALAEKIAADVAAGRADAFFYDQISIAKHAKQNPDTTRAILTPFTYEPFCIAIQKGDFDLWQWIEMFLTTVKADGTLEALRRKYFGEILN